MRNLQTTKPQNDTDVIILEDATEHESRLHAILGVPARGARLSRRLRIEGWLVTAIAAVIAFVTRFWGLNHPHKLVFDETYYVKGAYSLLTRGYEGDWSDGKIADPLFIAGDYSDLKDAADYVVHPPLGKWLMALGQGIFGTDNGVGWRCATAFIGVLAVILLVRITLKMFRSPWLAGFAGVAMALDGMGIVLSRTGILDNMLAFFVLLGFWAVLVDREWMRARLAQRVASGSLVGRDATETPADSHVRSWLRHAPELPYTPKDPWGPSIVWRPWMVVAGLAFGAACGVKWSGIYAVAVFGIVAFAWGCSARRLVGARLWFGAGVFRDGFPAFFALVPTAIVTYIAAWIPWFANPHGYFRDWAAAEAADLPLGWAPDVINSFLHYHAEMWSFHHGLSSPHTYQSQMWEWILQLRPVSFYWTGTAEAPTTCTSGQCVEAISSIGNIAVWWLGFAALFLVVWAAIRRHEWRAWAILAGYAALWLPWLSYTNRTIFQFYAVAFLPFVVLALTYALGFVTSLLPTPQQLRAPEPGRKEILAIVSVTALIAAVATFWFPLWTGQVIDYDFWHAHMWFARWI